MTLTNTTGDDLSIIEVSATGDYSETDDCVSSSPLAAGAMCTITVTFQPTQVGIRNGQVRMTNSFTHPVSFWLTGVGQ